MNGKFTVSALLLSILIFPTVQEAQAREKKNNQARDIRSERVVSVWTKDLKKIDHLIRAGESRKALDRGNRLAEEVVEKVSGGSESRRLVGSINVLRALAAYGVGDTDLALWHWQIGLQMFPEVAQQVDLSQYGDAGQFLLDHMELRKALYDASPNIEGFTLPKKKRTPMPRMPPARRMELQRPLSVTVNVVVGKDGRLRDPEILKADGEFTLVCATLEAFRRWEFEPATLHGEPVASNYKLITNFRTEVHPR